MKTYNTQPGVEKDIIDGVLTLAGDVTFQCSISVNASIIISRGSITAWDIISRDIIAGDIMAENIVAIDLSYDTFCIAYKSLTCLSWKSVRKEYLSPVALDGELV